MKNDDDVDFWNMSDDAQEKYIKEMDKELKRKFLIKFHWLNKAQIREAKFAHGYFNLFVSHFEEIIYRRLDIKHNIGTNDVRDHNYIYKIFIYNAKKIINDPELLFALDEYKDRHVICYHTNKSEREILNNTAIGTNNDEITDSTNVVIILINRRIVSDIESLNKIRERIMKAERFHWMYRKHGGFIDNYIRQHNRDNGIIVKIQKQISETQLEELIVKNIDKVESGMTVIARQYQVANGFIDILAEDNNGTKCIIELKITDHCKDIVFQAAYYPSQFNEKVRMITICPDYKGKINAALKNISGVEMKTYYFNQVNDQLHIEDYTK